MSKALDLELSFLLSSSSLCTVKKKGSVKFFLEFFNFSFVAEILSVLPSYTLNLFGPVLICTLAKTNQVGDGQSEIEQCLILLPLPSPPPSQCKILMFAGNS